MFVSSLRYEEYSLAQMGDHTDRGVLRTGIWPEQFKNHGKNNRRQNMLYSLPFLIVILNKLILIINQLYEQLLR